MSVMVGGMLGFVWGILWPVLVYFVMLTQQLVWSARWGPQQVSSAASSFASQQRRTLINFAAGVWARWYAGQPQKQTQQMIDWVKSRHQPTIVGHTHVPYGATNDENLSTNLQSRSASASGQPVCRAIFPSGESS